MLRFVDFDLTHTDRTGPIPGAYLIGQDQVAIAGEVARENGVIHCEKTTPDAAALALQVDLGRDQLAMIDDSPSESGIELSPLGTLVLQTCLLPERERPYPLVLELARHRIMLVLQRLEHWQAFEHAEGTDAMEMFYEARRRFVDALASAHATIEPGSEPARSALRALWLGIESAERLTALQARHDLSERLSGRLYERLGDESDDRATAQPVLHPSRGGVVLPHKPLVGTLVSPGVFSESTTDAVARSCDFLTVPMRWREMEPAEGVYDFSRTDRWIEWAIRTAKIPVVAGPLIDFRAVSAPDWLYIWENDYETLRELVYEHIKTLVTRYRRTVTRWTVCSGLHCGESFKLSFEQMMDLTRICVLVTRKLHPRAKIQIEITQPWGEYHTRDRASLPPLLYAEMLSQAGVQLDAFSVRLQMGSSRPGLQTRDLMTLSDLLDRYSMLDRPITVSSFGVPAATEPPGEGTTSDTGPPPAPGSWRRDWSDPTQADWLGAVGAIALSKPYIESVCWHELVDPSDRGEMPEGGLMRTVAEPRKSLSRLAALRDTARGAALRDHWFEDAIRGPSGAPSTA